MDRGPDDVEKQDLAMSVGNGSNPATETTTPQQPSLTLTGLPFLLLLLSVILALLQIALNATITSTVCKPSAQALLMVVVVYLTLLLSR